MLIFSAIVGGVDLDEGRLTQHVQEQLRRLGITLNDKEGKPVNDQAQLQTMVAAEVKSFLEGKLPLWRRLGVL